MALPNYGKANLAMQDIYNKLYNEKRNWFHVCIAEFIVIVLLAAGVIIAASFSKPYPWIVQVDEHGFEVSVGRAGDQNIDRRVVISRIGRFIQSSRGIITDPKAEEAAIKWAYSAVAKGSKAEVKLTDELKKLRPYAHGSKGETIEVVINNVLPKSDKTYQVNWTEKSWQGDAQTETIDYTGLFTVDISPLKEGKDIINNPLGIFITEYTFDADYIQQ